MHCYINTYFIIPQRKFYNNIYSFNVVCRPFLFCFVGISIWKFIVLSGRGALAIVHRLVDDEWLQLTSGIDNSLLLSMTSGELESVAPGRRYLFTPLDCTEVDDFTPKYDSKYRVIYDTKRKMVYLDNLLFNYYDGFFCFYYWVRNGMKIEKKFINRTQRIHISNI